MLVIITVSDIILYIYLNIKSPFLPQKRVIEICTTSALLPICLSYLTCYFPINGAGTTDVDADVRDGSSNARTDRYKIGDVPTNILFHRYTKITLIFQPCLDGVFCKNMYAWEIENMWRGSYTLCEMITVKLNAVRLSTREPSRGWEYTFSVLSTALILS